MSTLLVVSAVLVAALVVVMGIALDDSDQPATIRSRTRRADRKRKRRRDRPPPRPLLIPAAARSEAEPTVTAPVEPPSSPTETTVPIEFSAELEASAPTDMPVHLGPPVEAPAPTPAAVEGTTLVQAPEVERPPRGSVEQRETPVPPPPAAPGSHRVRSGVALMVMIAVLGTLVAFAVGAAVILISQALKHAVS